MSTSSRDVLLGKAVDWFAANGVGDTSLRTLASAIGTSHRMLIYHFGSREGLLSAVVETIWRQQQRTLEELLDNSVGDPMVAAWAFWSHIADHNDVFAPLFFELAASAMQGHRWAADLRQWVADWTQTVSKFFVGLGHSPEEAHILGRTAMALTRGTLFELALDGDRKAADQTMRMFLESTTPAP